MVHLNVFWSRPQSYYDQATWRGTWEFDGGALMNQASHYIDLMDWLIGPIDKVQAMTSTTRDIEVEDTGVVNIKWRNGTLGSVSVTMLTYPKNLEGSVTILGERGTVRIGGMAVNRIEAWEFSDKKDYDKEIEVSNYETDSVYGFGHLKYYENVIDVLKNKTNTPLIKELKRSLSIPIHMQTHATTGMSAATNMKAIEAGIDNIDTSISSLSMTYGHSATETMLAIFEDQDRHIDLDLDALDEVSIFFKDIREKYSEFEGGLKGVDSTMLVKQVPGGMLSNFCLLYTSPSPRDVEESRMPAWG